VRRVLYAALIGLLVLHNDFWLWNDSRRILGLPLGLIYHVLYCVAASVLMALLVRFAWPAGLEVDDQDSDEGGAR
jgi:Protein of unknown function (DUF3311)